ncbi:MAG: hypothetical protein QXX17_04555 [Conexivisphaerales archaeon]
MGRAIKGHTYTDREIAGWMSEVDGKEHGPSWVHDRMEHYYLEGKPGIGKSIDEKTGRFVGWRRTG